MKFRESTPDEQIALLMERRGVLEQQREMLQKKIDVFEERVKEREVEKQKKRAKAASESR